MLKVDCPSGESNHQLIERGRRAVHRGRLGGLLGCGGLQQTNNAFAHLVGIWGRTTISRCPTRPSLELDSRIDSYTQFSPPLFLVLTIHSYIASASARDLLKGSKPHRFPSSLCAAVALVPGPPSQTPPIPPPAIPSNTVGAPTADSLSPAPAPRSNSSDLAIKKYPPKSACKASKVRSVRPKCNNCKDLSWSDPEFAE
jgi:hypothetical protein